jgi:hypothetical protein
MTRLVVPVLALALVCAVPLAAADKKTEKPLGTWTKAEGDRTVTFTFKADALTTVLKGGEAKIEATCDYGVTKDGVLFGRIGKVSKEGVDGGPDEGDLFSFRFKLADNKLVISDLNGTKINEEARKLVEGDYEKKK